MKSMKRDKNSIETFFLQACLSDTFIGTIRIRAFFPLETNKPP